jgi:chitodextrinase
MKKMTALSSVATVTGLTPNTSYAFTVKAVDAAGNASAFSNEAEGKTDPAPDVTAPAAPANLKVLSVTTGSISLDWDNATDNVAVTGYDIYVNGTKTISSTTSDAVVSGLSPNTTYSFSVKAFDDAGNVSGFSNTVSGKTNQLPDVAPPTNPSNLRVLSVTTNSVSLDWDNSTDAGGVSAYSIYVDGVKKQTSTSSNAVVTGLTPNTSYSFTVNAVDLSGNVSGFSNAVTGKTNAVADVTAPSVPANLKVLSVTTNSVSLDWDNSTDNVGVTGYDIYVGGVKKMSSTTSNAVVTGLTPNTSYSFTVKALDLAGNASGFSSAVTGKTSQVADVSAPSAPANLKVVSVTSNSISLNWDNSTDNVGVTGYDVYVNGVKKFTASASDFNVTGLSPNTSYTFVVRAFDAAGNTSAASASVTGKTSVLADVTKPTAPKNLKVVYTTRTTIELQWDKSTDNVGVVKYDVYVNAVRKSSVTGTKVVITGLPELKTYLIGVVALDQAGNISPASNIVAAKTQLQGLKFSYYEGSWNVLPNFNSLTAVKEGVTPDVNLDERRRNENYGFVWQGYIKIPRSGNYTFETISDDGSKFYFNSLYVPTATALVNNDGLHSEKSVTKTIYVTAGVYPVAATFFEKTGDARMRLMWKGPNISRQEIPASAFSDISTGSFNRGRDDDDDDDDFNWWDLFFNQNAGSNELAEQPLATPGAVVPEITKAYPSPFVDRLNIEFSNKVADSKVEIKMYDVYGKLVHVQQFNGLPAGRNTLNINLSNRQLTAGVYMLRMYVNGTPSKLMKLMRSSQ